MTTRKRNKWINILDDDLENDTKFLMLIVVEKIKAMALHFKTGLSEGCEEKSKLMKEVVEAGQRVLDNKYDLKYLKFNQLGMNFNKLNGVKATDGEYRDIMKKSREHMKVDVDFVFNTIRDNYFSWID